MSIESRSSTALFVRAEQLKRWEESDTNREPGVPKPKARKVNFSSGCVFLAACAAGEKDEVFRLLREGADIDTANVDGLTALHQACIDDNLEMVEFLVENGADVNRGDNEGWTPLHATASCGFLSIAKYLIEHGADVAAVNNDGQLAIDVTDHNSMEDFLKAVIKERGIDCDAARNEEEMMMLKDAKEWLLTKKNDFDKPHPKTGATPLHVASAKGYTEVMKILLQCGADVDKQDVDGWTPLHAAAHWDQQDALQILAENLADMDVKNYAGQTAFDLASTPEMCNLLEDLRKKQNKEEVLNRRQAKKRTEILEAETPMKVKKVEVEIEGKEQENIDMEVSSESETESESDDSSSSSESEENSTDDEKRNRVNSLSVTEKPATVTIKDAETIKTPVANPPKQLMDVNSEDNMQAWRKINLKPTVADSTLKNSAVNKDKMKNEEEVTIRRTNSFKNDPEFYNRYMALHARIKATSYPNSNSSPFPLIRSSPIITYPDKVQRLISNSTKEKVGTTTSSATTTTITATNTTANTTVSPASSPLPNNQPSRIRSFVPPSRDEESETQRKAHAKRVRETRRSTQCVTIEEIKSAEQIVKNKSQSGGNTNANEQLGSNGDPSNGVSVTATITTATPTVITREAEETTEKHERRPSWRLKIDAGSKFKLEEVTKSSEPPSTPSFMRRPTVQTTTTTTTITKTTPIETGDTTTVTLPLRRPKSQEEKEQDKENDARIAQATLATQAAIQRRKRPKRRSTGLVNFDNVDDLEPDKDPAAGGDCEDTSKMNHQDSGSERSNRSRLGSSNDIPHRTENGEIDYKKLYEQTLVENERLKDKLRKTEEELRDTKQTLERINVVTSKNSLSELEKRERRAMERKLSEMEEELKQLQKLKAENERLRADNRSLTRVINKLTNSAKK